MLQQMTRRHLLNSADLNPSALEPQAMNLHPINPPVRVLIRTRPAELQKIEPSIYKADSILVDKLCAELSIIDTTKVAHLITKIADEKKERERVDIIFDYGVPADDVQPEVRSTVPI
jgi:hypothetical protein